jgi:hypothetical protein
LLEPLIDVFRRFRVAVLKPRSASLAVGEGAQVSDAAVVVINDELALPGAVHELPPKLPHFWIGLEHAENTTRVGQERLRIEIRAVLNRELVERTRRSSLAAPDEKDGE